mmetsp:Transcript_20389/g.51503  ORF Transcript_20389/g.51503 Transcript_20389/m.51503 type:complete len:880 (+) Transcript_20389:334-2973(+)
MNFFSAVTSLLPTHAVERETLKPGDHVYVYRMLFTYSHHGIVVAVVDQENLNEDLDQLPKQTEGSAIFHAAPGAAASSASSDPVKAADTTTTTSRSTRSASVTVTAPPKKRVYVVHFSMDGCKLNTLDDFIRGGIFSAIATRNAGTAGRPTSTTTAAADSLGENQERQAAHDPEAESSTAAAGPPGSLLPTGARAAVDAAVAAGASRQPASSLPRATAVAATSSPRAASPSARPTSSHASNSHEEATNENLLDEMILGTRIRRVKYGVTYAESMVKRAGTVNCRAASPWFVVVLRALSMVEVIEEQKELEYHFLEKNCELFCEYCVCGPPETSSKGNSPREDDDEAAKVDSTSVNATGTTGEVARIGGGAADGSRGLVPLAPVGTTGPLFLMSGADGGANQAEGHQAAGQHSETLSTHSGRQFFSSLAEDSSAGRKSIHRRRLRFRDLRQRSQQTQTSSIVKTVGIGAAAVGLFGVAGAEIFGMGMLLGLAAGAAEGTAGAKKEKDDDENVECNALAEDVDEAAAGETTENVPTCTAPDQGGHGADAPDSRIAARETERKKAERKEAGTTGSRTPAPGPAVKTATGSRKNAAGPVFVTQAANAPPGDSVALSAPTVLPRLHLVENDNLSRKRESPRTPQNRNPTILGPPESPISTPPTSGRRYNNSGFSPRSPSFIRPTKHRKKESCDKTANSNSRRDASRPRTPRSKDKKEKKSSPRGRGESRGRVLSSKDVEVRFVGQEFSPRSTKDKDGEKLRSRGSDDGANPSGATSSTGAAGAAVSPTTGTTRPPPIQAEIPFTAADCLDAMWRELGVPVKFEPPLTPVEAVVLSDMLVESFEEPESFLAPGFGGPTTEVGGPVAEDAALMRIQRTLHLFQELR